MSIKKIGRREVLGAMGAAGAARFARYFTAKQFRQRLLALLELEGGRG